MNARAPCHPTIMQPITSDAHLVKVISHVRQLPSEGILGGHHEAADVFIELSRSCTPFLCSASCVKRKRLCSLSAVRCGHFLRAARILICRGSPIATQVRFYLAVQQRTRREYEYGWYGDIKTRYFDKYRFPQCVDVVPASSMHARGTV